MNKDRRNANEQETSKDNKEYHMGIDGKSDKVDIVNDEEYSCLLNCLKDYYIYGIGRDDEYEDNNTTTIPILKSNKDFPTRLT